MIKYYLLLSVFFPLICLVAQNEPKATIRLNDITLMNEMRVTPFPIDGAIVTERSVSFQWPLPSILNGVRSGLDGAIEVSAQNSVDKNTLRYLIRYSTNPSFEKSTTIQVETKWPFHNLEEELMAGTWYWQYASVIDGKTVWSDVFRFIVQDNSSKFCPPSLQTVLQNLPTHHPRIWLNKDEWNEFIEQSKGTVERETYLAKAAKVLSVPMKSVNDIHANRANGLTNEMQRNAMLTRESRRIIDSEESNTDVLIRAYLLTRNRIYADEAIKRVQEMCAWSGHKNVKGDFNEATLLSLCSMAYDALYEELDIDMRSFLLEQIKKLGQSIYIHNMNRLENHIADNHVWQMIFRIFTMASFATYGEIEEANEWTDYCYNLWVARFPGLNKDGGWHNGDSYFHVNIRTLIEVPYFYTRLTGFNYFKDPWYQGNTFYVIYQQPPFSKSGGNGSSHQNILMPSGTRVSYADALARVTGNTYAADYVRSIQSKQPDILNQGNISKSGGLAWFRLQCRKSLPEGPGLKELPMGYVFPQTGLASFSTNLSETAQSAMLSFRSSPYGSTSHALANQNSFNTFWNGQPLFYSSGHHISFTDKHSVYCHRATRAHNTVLVNGMGQRIGTEGYGWIPRCYVSDAISYVVGDASNAYGKVISPLWLLRGKQSELSYSPENGWDETGLEIFRRHVIVLGKSGYTFIYDELKAAQPVTWSYLLHTITNPMKIQKTSDHIHVQATSEDGISDAYLYASGPLKIDITHDFFVPAINWLRADENGYFKPYPKHWHFTATSQKEHVYRFATILYTHAKHASEKVLIIIPRRLEDGSIQIGEWNIKANLSCHGSPFFEINCTQADKNISVMYNNYGSTKINDNGVVTELVDEVPELEI